MAKRKVKIHPELKSAVNTFLAGFLPVLGTQLGTIDAQGLEYSAIFGLVLVAVRMAVKYGLANLFKWVVEKCSNYKFE